MALRLVRKRRYCKFSNLSGYRFLGLLLQIIGQRVTIIISDGVDPNLQKKQSGFFSRRENDRDDLCP